MKSQLLRLIRTHAVRHGTFKMASGATSNVLIDLSGVLRRADTQRLIEINLPDELYQVRIDVMGGAVCGSDLVAAPLARAGVAKHWFGVRKEPKGRGLDQELITGELRAEDRVLLIEDVITTGGTALRAAEAIRKHGATIVGVFCIVDRGGLAPLCEKLGVNGWSLFTLEDFSHGV